MYVYIYMHTYIHKYIFKYVYLHILICIYIYIHVFTSSNKIKFKSPPEFWPPSPNIPPELELLWESIMFAFFLPFPFPLCTTCTMSPTSLLLGPKAPAKIPDYIYIYKYVYIYLYTYIYIYYVSNIANWTEVTGQYP
jgi:hypothetical protein